MKTKELTPLDRKLQQLALEDFDAFVELIGEDAVISAKICLLRSEGKSYGKISLSLSVTERVAEKRSKKCNLCKED